jgi:hypothetical protein
MDEAATDYGRSAIVVLDIDGEERSVWLFEAAFVSKFREELAKRPSGDFTAGERVEIDRGTEKVESANGRNYWPYRVRFESALTAQGCKSAAVGLVAVLATDGLAFPGSATLGASAGCAGGALSTEDARTRRAWPVAGHEPWRAAMIGRGSKVARTRTILPSSIRLQLATAAGGAIEVCS